ncbi:rab-GTPase-TBC domain-containing protein [Coemansia spiralis]|nr:rab-GTPase-TBC domain-containing protein [Coemansia spiralis]
MGGGPAEGDSGSGGTLSEFSDYCIVSEVAQVRLLYSKSKVYVYRSTDKKDRISGFICIVQGPDDHYYIAWTPEALLSEHEKESYVQVEICPAFPATSGDSDNANNSSVSISMFSEDGGIQVSTEALTNATSISSMSNYAFCKPVGDIASMLIHPPSLTQWYGSMILNLADGSSLAPMWFHDDESASTMLGMTRHWGGDELLVWLAHIVSIERSVDDPNCYEIRGSKTPYVIHSYASTPGSSTMLPAQGARQNPSHHSTSSEAIARADSAQDSSANRTAGLLDSALSGNVDPLVQQMKDLRWGILEHFSRITRTVKDAASSFIETPVGRQVAPYIPPSISNIGRNNSASGSLVKEYESARIYLAKWAAQHIIEQQHEDGKRESRLAAEASSPAANGKDKSGQKDLGYSSIWEEWIAENGDLGSFEVITTNKSANIPQPIRTMPPLSAEQWLGFFEPVAGAGNLEFRLIADSESIRRAIFAGGIEEDLRPVVWKYLLEIYPWGSSETERKSIDKEKADEYWVLKDKWLSDPTLKETADFIEQCSRIDKDVLRTDRTLPLFATDSMYGGSDEANLSEHGLPGSSASLEKMKDILMTFHYYDKGTLGYVQGMSDLLAPIYSVYQDEPTTFWAFSSFMRRMRSHFLRDQSGMQDELTTLANLVEIANPQLFKHLEQCDASNMFCCYRWLLIWFKREFSFEDILKLWEVLWTDYLTDRFVLFVALAILQRHSDVIIDHLRSPEEVLKYVQDLSDTIDLNDALKGAEMCFYKVRYRVQTVEQIRKGCGLPEFTGNEKTDGDSSICTDDNSGATDRHSKKSNAVVPDGAEADPEVPLISFEWEEPRDTSSSLEDVLLPAVGRNNVDNEGESLISRTPLLSPIPTFTDKGKGACSKEDSIITTTEEDVNKLPDIALPEITKTIHDIFAAGYKY